MFPSSSVKTQTWHASTTIKPLCVILDGFLLHHHPAGSHRQPCQMLQIIINQTELTQYNSLVNISASSGPMGCAVCHHYLMLVPFTLPLWLTVCVWMCSAVSLYPQLPYFCVCVYWMCGSLAARSSAYHLHTLHQRQPHRLVTAQRDHAGRRVSRGLQKGEDSLHTHTTGLCEQTHKHTYKTASSSQSKPPVFLLYTCNVLFTNTFFPKSRDSFFPTGHNIGEKMSTISFSLLHFFSLFVVHVERFVTRCLWCSAEP